MSFDLALEEIRERLVESLSMLQYIRTITPSPPATPEPMQKTLRGLWLVALYASFERSVNLVVDAAIIEICQHGSKIIDFSPEIQPILHYDKIRALKDSGYKSVFEKSSILFSAAFSQDSIDQLENPLSERLTNVDGTTLKWVAKIFGAATFDMDMSELGRLSNLRERRNAVAHGRESASQVGQRYSLDEMNTLYSVVDASISTFLLMMKDHCTTKGYLRSAA